jgi:phage baseplate assembly protein gpV
VGIDPMQKLLFQVAELKRQASYSARMGTIHEIKGDKMRVNMGLKHNGEPWLGPWVNTTDHRGAETQQEVYKVGQNVEMSALGGDYAQASVAPHGPNEKTPAPSHASEGNSTWQHGDSAHTRNDSSQNFMRGEGNNPTVNMRVSDNGFTGFVEKGKHRVHANSKGVVISYQNDENCIFVDDEGCASTKPLMVRTPKVKPDNKSK